MRRRLVSGGVLAVAGGLLALSGAGAQEQGQDPVEPPQGTTPSCKLTGQVVDGKLSYDLACKDQLPAVVKITDAKAHAVWKRNAGVVAFRIRAELLYSPGDGGGVRFTGFGVDGELEEGTDFDIREAGWRADRSLEGPRSAGADVAGIVTPTMIGEDEFFALELELPAVFEHILPF